MKYRALDPTGDYAIGKPFLVNSPPCVAQAISTRLKLWKGEWFLDTTVGTPWTQSILGRSVNPDAYIKQAILSTPGVNGLVSYNSSYDGKARALTVTGVASTVYSTTPFAVSVSVG